MNRAKLLLIVAFIMVFAAGIAMGAILQRVRQPHWGPARLAHELGLTPEQRRSLGEIWSPVREQTREFPAEARRELSEKRDKAIRELLPQDQISRFEEIAETYQREKEELMKAWKAPIDEAVEKTRQILSEQQFQKFEEVRKRRMDRGGVSGHGNYGPGTDNTVEEESSK
jgi:Spy/CpxP family protein refolding chaperone